MRARRCPSVVRSLVSDERWLNVLFIVAPVTTAVAKVPSAMAQAARLWSWCRVVVRPSVEGGSRSWAQSAYLGIVRYVRQGDMIRMALSCGSGLQRRKLECEINTRASAVSAPNALAILRRTARQHTRKLSACARCTGGARGVVYEVVFPIQGKELASATFQFPQQDPDHGSHSRSCS